MLYARSPGVDTPHSWLASPCVDAARRSSPRLRGADAGQNMAGGMQPASAQSGARATPVSGGASPVIHRDEAQRAIVVHRPPRRAHARRVAVAQAATAASTQMEAAPSPCFEQASPVLGSAPSPPVNQRADHFVVRKAAEIPYMPMNPPVRRGKRGQSGPGRGPGDALAPIGDKTFSEAVRHGWRFMLQPGAFGRRRRRMTAAEKEAAVTHDDFLDYKKENAVEWLSQCVSPELRDLMLGGDLAVAQCPSEEERQDAFIQLVRSRAGPDGSACGKVRRFLEALYAAAPENHLPATRLLVNRVITRESVRALTAATGSQGGASVAGSMRAGAVAAYNMGFPVEAVNLLVDAAAPPARKRARERRAGSIPIKWYCAFDHWARTMPPGVERLWVRSILIAWLSSRLRLVDVLRAYIRPGGFTPDGVMIIQVIASFSKDGQPIDIYIRAMGPLGKWEWAAEHIEDMKDKKFCLPAFKSPVAGDITRAESTLERVTARGHASQSLRSIAARAPLKANEAVWKALSITDHSGHGSPSDMAAVVGVHAEPDVAMCEADERELGHWRRMTRHQEDGELELEPELQEAVHLAERQHGQPGGQRPNPPAAIGPVFEAEDAEMRIRYTSGSNREGRRRAQLRVHLRWVTAMQRALLAFGKPWQELPGDRSEYDLLESLPRARELEPPA